MIHVIAAIEVTQGKRDALLAEFHRLVPLVLAEAGCLEYGPTIDVPTSLAAQIPLRQNVVTIVEKWESVDALQAHMATKHMVDYGQRVKDIVVSVKVQVLTAA